MCDDGYVSDQSMQKELRLNIYKNHILLQAFLSLGIHRTKKESSRVESSDHVHKTVEAFRMNF